MLTATFHDIGYAIQETEFWLNRIFEEFLGVNPKFALSIAQVMPMIYLDFMRILSAYHESGTASLSSACMHLPSSRIDWIFYNEINSGLIEKNHGVLSALMLAHLLGIRQKFLAEEEKWNFKYNHLPACHAIATHMLPSIRVSFAKHPFAFLLVLCDEIQDWSRSPSSKETQNTVYLRDVEVSSRPTEIRFRVKTSKKRREKLRNTLKERLCACMPKLRKWAEWDDEVGRFNNTQNRHLFYDWIIGVEDENGQRLPPKIGDHKDVRKLRTLYEDQVQFRVFCDTPDLSVDAAANRIIPKEPTFDWRAVLSNQLSVLRQIPAVDFQNPRDEDIKLLNDVMEQLKMHLNMIEKQKTG